MKVTKSTPNSPWTTTNGLTRWHRLSQIVGALLAAPVTVPRLVSGYARESSELWFIRTARILGGPRLRSP